MGLTLDAYAAAHRIQLGICERVVIFERGKPRSVVGIAHDLLLDAMAARVRQACTLLAIKSQPPATLPPAAPSGFFVPPVTGSNWSSLSSSLAGVRLANLVSA